VNFSSEELAELRRRLASPATDTGGLSGKSLARFEEKLRTGHQK